MTTSSPHPAFTQPITLTLAADQSDLPSTVVREYVYVCPHTQRSFVCEEADADNAAIFPPFYVWEWVPSGGLLCIDADGAHRVLRLPLPPDDAAGAHRVVREGELMHPGYHASYGGGGYGVHTIYRPSLAACEKAIRNALLSNRWISTSHPIRTVRLAPRPDAWTMTMDAAGALAATPDAQRTWELALARLDEVAPAHHLLRVSLEDRSLRLELHDPTQTYPDTIRAYTSLCLDTMRWGARYDRTDFAMAKAPYGPVLERICGFSPDAPGAHVDGEHSGLPRFGE